jgi:peroxiredoxin
MSARPRSRFFPAAMLCAFAAAGCLGGAPGRSSFIADLPAGSSGDGAAVAPPAYAPRTSSEELAAQSRKASIGAPAPGFELVGLDGRVVRLADYRGKIVVLEWFNPACPYSAFAWGENGPLRELSERLLSQGTVWLAINSESAEKAGGQVERIERFARENKMRAPVLLDPEGKVGRAYDTKTTPQMFVISPKGVLVYRGALDNAPLGKVRDDAAKTNYVEVAIADLKSGRAVTAAETKPYGSPVSYAK